MVVSNEVKLTFVFKEENDAYYLALENKSKFNHDFVKKFRDHVAEKNRLGTISNANVQKVLLDFYFECEKRCSVSKKYFFFIIF